MNAPRMRSRTSPRAWLSVLCVALCVAFKSAHGVANIELFEPPLPFPVETHPLELSAAMFASDLPLANATVKFRPTDDAQTTLGDIPFPTGAWWTNLVLDQGDNFVSTMPYMLRVLQGKLQVAYPFRVVLPGIIQNGFISELVLTGSSKSTWQQQVVGFDSLGVAVRFTAPQDADAGAFTTHLVRGSPYLTVDYDGAVPVIESADGIKLQKLKRLDKIMTDMEGKPLTFPVFAVQNSGGHTWYIFGSDESLDLSLRKGKITGNSKYTGVLRFALALTGDALPLLVESAPVYAVGGEVKYQVDPKTDSAVVEFAWKTHTFPGFTDSSKLLMLALPHHNDTLTEASVTRIDDLRYTAIRGIMVGVLGDTWQMQEELPPVEWNYAKDQGLFNPAASSGPEEDAERAKMVQDVTELLVQNLKQDIQTFPHFAVDSYGFGKQMGREVRLLLIADSLGQKEEFNHQLEKIKRELEPWLAATNGDTLVYDERFGGLVTRNGLHDRNADFGNGYYNDHHFHYGYYMHGLAALRKFDPEFIAKYASAAAMLIADIGTPLDSTKTKFFSDFPARHYFPTARHKDWFVGHSYASGLFQMEVGKSQESSSECINAYYGMALFGSLDENAEQDPLSYYNYARMMLALELRSTKKYWHMRENSKVYEPLFAKNAMVGVVGEMSVVYSTWFGDRPEYVHGINMIPFTPITAELFNEGYVVREYGQLRPRFEALGPEDIWKSIIVMNHAILDGETAWNELLESVTAFDTWNSKTNALFWIATRPSWFDQRDRAKLNEVNLHDDEKCFGFPACAVAGGNGTSLACCDTMPGCCPSSLGCCPQKDVSKMPINSCFGEPKCAVLGLGCCASIDGCCEPNPFTGEVLGCCKDPTPRSVTPAPSMESDNDDDSSGFCTAQPKCEAAGLLCCESEEGCCKPDPVTGGKLDCCVAEPTSLKTCHSQPQCLAAGLLCCGTANGCCKPDPITGGKLDCCIDTHGAELNETTPTPVSSADVATCHNEPKCGEAGLDCCGSAEGCCQPDPVTGGKLLCCEGSAPTPIPQELVDPFGTCHGDIACLTAGDNGTALGCCGSREGCCPGLLCCAHHDDNGDNGEATTTTTGDGDKEASKGGSRVLLVSVGVVLLMVLAYGITTCYRRRQYAPIEQDMRAWWCGALGLFVFVFFVTRAGSHSTRFPRERPDVESWWRGFKASTTQPTRPRFSVDKARKFICYSETTSKLHQARVLLLFPVPGLLSALVAPLIPLRDPSEGIFRNYGFVCHALITVCLNMSGAMMEIRAVSGIPRRDFSNLQVCAVGIVGSLHVVGVAVLMARFWRFPIPFVWIVLAVPWLVFLMWSNLLVLRSKLIQNKHMRTNLIFSLPQLGVQLGQIALYPAYSALFEASNQWQQLLLIALFPLLKMALKRLVFAVSHHLSDYARETAISGVEISASMYQSMIMQSSPSQLATALVIGVDLIQGVVDVKRFMEGSSVIPKRELIVAATQILHRDEDTLGKQTTASATTTLAGSHPCGPQSPVRLPSNSETRSRNKAILGQALEMLQSAETILLIEYIEVAVPITNAIFLCVASQLQSALFNPKLRKFYGNYTELSIAISTMLIYTFLQAITLILMCLVMRVRYRVSAFTLLAFVLEHHAWSLHGKMIAWLTSILEFSVIHFGVDFSFRFDFRMDK